MQRQLKETLKKLLPHPVLNILKKYYQKKQYNNWVSSGRPLPPPHLVKQKAISQYQKMYGLGVLVETGTYMGDMLEAQKKDFKKIYSIELGESLYHKAVKRFAADKHISIKLGDSAKVLPGLMREIDEPALFWLDGHYSAGITAKAETECPIYDELAAILDHSNLPHVLLIDDARCFNGSGDYPTTDALKQFVHEKDAAYQMDIADDVIRFVKQHNR